MLAFFCLLTSHKDENSGKWTFSLTERETQWYEGVCVSGGFVLLVLKDGPLTTQKKDHAYIHWYP